MGKAEGVLGAVLLCTLIAALVASHTSGAPDNLLYHYQTFVIGVLTVSAATIAALLLYHQIKQQRDLEVQRKNDHREAARSWLSLQVSLILAYAEDTGSDLWELYSASPNDAPIDIASIPVFPKLPMSAATAMKEFAQFTKGDEAQFIALIFASMQLLDTNVRSLKTSKISHYKSNLESYLIYAAELYARAEALLDYARHVTDDFPKGVEWKRVRGAMFFMTLSDSPTDLISDYITKGSGGDLSSYLPNRFKGYR